jgi:hypothetical protein
VRAAGRAILLLIEEIERLNVDLWHARGLGSTEPETAAEVEPQQLPDDLGTMFRRRLGAFRYHAPSPPAEDR